jgi:hypothetical protein
VTRLLPLLVALALVLAAAPSSARRASVACIEGDVTCDLDGGDNARCVFGLCRVLCFVAPCPDVFEPCTRPEAERLVEVPLRRRGKAAGRRLVSLGLRRRVALRCVPPRDAGKPRLTTGCRSDLAADECAAHDGDFVRGGLLPEPRCQCRTTDAGAPCARGLDCQGFCRAALGDAEPTCSTHLVEFGCFTNYDDVGNVATLCVD